MYLANQPVNITDNLDYFARQVVEGFLVGLHKSPYHGFSVEFAEHRLYNHGDSIKNIDWKLYARSEKLFIKKFEEETNLKCYVLVDVSSSMRYPQLNNLNIGFNKFSFSIYSAACLAYLFQKQRDAFGLSCFSDVMESFIAAKVSKVHYNRIMVELHKLLNSAKQKCIKQTNLSHVVTDLIGKIPQRSLIVIFSDMINSIDDDDIFHSLSHLKYKKHEVILFHVKHSDTEEFFNFPNKPHRFIDLESNNLVELNPQLYKQQYIDRYEGFQRELKLKCNQYGIDYVSASIDLGFKQILTAYLQKRSRLL